MRLAECSERLRASPDAVPLPAEGLLDAVLQRQNRYGHAPLQDRLPGLAGRVVPGHDESQGRLQHEAAPGPRHHAKDCVVPGPAAADCPVPGRRAFSGPVEADETDMGGKRKNMPGSKRVEMTGREAVSKPAVVGAEDRAT